MKRTLRLLLAFAAIATVSIPSLAATQDVFELLSSTLSSHGRAGREILTQKICGLADVENLARASEVYVDLKHFVQTRDSLVFKTGDQVWELWQGSKVMQVVIGTDGSCAATVFFYGL